MIPRRIIAITGGSGAGKSWFASFLLRRLPPGEAFVLAEDDYYQDFASRPGFDPALTNFDEPASLDHDLLAAHLGTLRAGRAVDAPLYDFARHGRIGTRRIEPCPVLIVEGLLLLTSVAVRAAIDCSAFLDAPEGRRLARRVARDTAERGRTPQDVRAQFAATVRPMHERHVAPSAGLATLRLVLSGDPEADQPLFDAAASRLLGCSDPAIGISRPSA